MASYRTTANNLTGRLRRVQGRRMSLVGSIHMYEHKHYHGVMVYAELIGEWEGRSVIVPVIKMHRAKRKEGR